MNTESENQKIIKGFRKIINFLIRDVLTNEQSRELKLLIEAEIEKEENKNINSKKQ